MCRIGVLKPTGLTPCFHSLSLSPLLPLQGSGTRACMGSQMLVSGFRQTVRVFGSGLAQARQTRALCAARKAQHGLGRSSSTGLGGHPLRARGSLDRLQKCGWEEEEQSLQRGALQGWAWAPCPLGPLSPPHRALPCPFLLRLFHRCVCSAPFTLLSLFYHFRLCQEVFIPAFSPLSLSPSLAFFLNKTQHSWAVK